MATSYAMVLMVDFMVSWGLKKMFITPGTKNFKNFFIVDYLTDFILAWCKMIGHLPSTIPPNMMKIFGKMWKCRTQKANSIRGHCPPWLPDNLGGSGNSSDKPGGFRNPGFLFDFPYISSAICHRLGSTHGWGHVQNRKTHENWQVQSRL
jgi:hypothetical protein